MTEAQKLCVQIDHLQERINYLNDKYTLNTSEWHEYEALVEELEDCYCKLYSLPGFISDNFTKH